MVNTRLIIKLIVVLAVLLFMVIMGMSNQGDVAFRFLGAKSEPGKAAFMYFIFFSAGVFVGAVITVGLGRSSK